MKIKISEDEFVKLYFAFKDFGIIVKIDNIPVVFDDKIHKTNDLCIEIHTLKRIIDIVPLKCEKIDNFIIFDINEFIEKVEKTGLIEVFFDKEKNIIMIRPAIQIKVEMLNE